MSRCENDDRGYLSLAVYRHACRVSSIDILSPIRRNKEVSHLESWLRQHNWCEHSSCIFNYKSRKYASNWSSWLDQCQFFVTSWHRSDDSAAVDMDVRIIQIVRSKTSKYNANWKAVYPVSGSNRGGEYGEKLKVSGGAKIWDRLSCTE